MGKWGSDRLKFLHLLRTALVLSAFSVYSLQPTWAAEIKPDCNQVVQTSGVRGKLSRWWKLLKAPFGKSRSEDRRFSIDVLNAEISDLPSEVQKRILVDLLPQLRPYSGEDLVEVLQKVRDETRGYFYLNLRRGITKKIDSVTQEKLRMLLSREDRRAAVEILNDRWMVDDLDLPKVELTEANLEPQGDGRIVLWKLWDQLEADKLGLYDARELLLLLEQVPVGHARGFNDHGLPRGVERRTGRLPYDQFLAIMGDFAQKTGVRLELKSIPMDLLVTAVILDRLAHLPNASDVQKQRAFEMAVLIFRESRHWEKISQPEQWNWLVFFRRLGHID